MNISHINQNPLASESFRSYLSRYIKAQVTNPIERRNVRNVVMKHYREAGLDLEAPAVDCLAAIAEYRFNNRGAQ